MLPKLVDMRRTDEEKKDDAGFYAPGNQPEYPYGLSLCFDDAILKKLGLDSSCEVGDLIHLFALAKVTSISKNETTNGPRSRVELQIVMMGTESEDEENESEEQPLAKHGYLRAG